MLLGKGKRWKGFSLEFIRDMDLRKSEDVTLNWSVCGLSFKADLLFYNVCIRTKGECPLLDIVADEDWIEEGNEKKRGGKKWCYIILKYWRVSYKWKGWQCNICIHFNWLFSCSLLVEYFTFENAWRVMDGEISIIKHGNTSVFVSQLFPCDKTIRFIRRLLSR